MGHKKQRDMLYVTRENPGHTPSEGSQTQNVTHYAVQLIYKCLGKSIEKKQLSD